MNKKESRFNTVVSMKITQKDREDLDRLCDALGVTKSEFLREKVSNINNYIMSKADLFNIPTAPKTDAWGRKITDEKSKQAKASASFKEKMNDEFNSNLTEKHGNVSAGNEGETPFSTPEGILVQMKNQEKKENK